MIHDSSAPLPVLNGIRIVNAVANGVTSNSAQIQAAINAGPGWVLMGPGAWLGGDIVLNSDTTLVGVGWSTVFQKGATNTYMVSVNPGAGGTPDPTTNVRNVGLRNMRMVGNSVLIGFSEQKHMINFNAVSDFLIDGLLCEAFEGDAVFLGSSNVAATERHNQRGTIRKSVFDGVNKANRNGLSVIDCDGLLTEDVYYTRCTAPTMPGAVDIEPDANAFSIIRNLTFRTVRMNDIGGNVGAFTMFLPLAQTAMTTPARNIVIDGLAIDNCVNALSLLQEANATETMPAQVVRVKDLFVNGASGRALQLDGLKDVCFTASTWRDCVGCVFLPVSQTCKDLRFQACTFERVGPVALVALQVRNVDRLTFDGLCEFIDCGATVTGGTGTAVVFLGGTSTYLNFSDCRFSSPLGFMGTAFVNGGHTFTPATNTNRGNVFVDGVDNGVVSGAFLPRPSGAASADRGVGSVALVTGVDFEIQRLLTNLTANITYTLDNTAVFVGQHFRIVIAQPAPAAFTVTVKDAGGTTLATHPASHNGMIDLNWDGAAYRLTGQAVV